MHPHPQTVQEILSDPDFQEQLSKLGFDPRANEFTLSCHSGPLAILIRRQPLDMPSGRFAALEYRLMIAPADRNGDIVYPGRVRRNTSQIVAIQVATITGLYSGEDSPQAIFEKTYAVGTGFLPDRNFMMRDLSQMNGHYNRQIQSFREFFLGSLGIK